MNIFSRKKIERNLLDRFIEAYYKFFDDILWNSSILIWLISFMMVWAVVLVSPNTSANLSTSLQTSVLNIKHLDSNINSWFININWIKYKIKLEEIKDNLTITF